MNAASLPLNDQLSDVAYWNGHKCWPLQEALVDGVPYMFHQIIDPLWDYEEAV